MSDRAKLAKAQQALLSGLFGYGPLPAGFDAERMAMVGDGLWLKRRGDAQKIWADTSRALGDRFAPLFDAYARAHPRPHWGHGTVDGFHFTRELRRQGRLPDAGKLELFDVELRAYWSHGQLHPRRGFAFGVVVLEDPRRIVFGLRLPFLGVKMFAIGSPTAARRWERARSRRLAKA